MHQSFAARYDDLRQVARRCLARMAPDMTLQPTALVHEAFLRIANRETSDFNGRTHFFAVAATALRHALLDHVRGNRREKRGHGLVRVALANDEPECTSTMDVGMVELDEVLQKLAAADPRAARVVEMKVFGGLDEQAIAALLEVSDRTVRSDWAFARAWLQRQLLDHEDH